MIFSCTGIQGTMLGEGVGWMPLSLRCGFGEHLSETHPIFVNILRPKKPLFYNSDCRSQLLNHMDGTGPPPMAKENIADIPTVIDIVLSTPICSN